MQINIKELPTKLKGQTAREAKNQCEVLKVINREPGLSTKEIARHVNISRHCVGRYLFQFLKDGVVTRERRATGFAYYLLPVESKKHG